MTTSSAPQSRGIGLRLNIFGCASRLRPWHFSLLIATVTKRRLIDGGHIYKGLHRGWYAVSDEAYYPESQVEERIDPTTGDISMVRDAPSSCTVVILNLAL